MSEIMTPPRIRHDKYGEEWATFGPEHTLSDIARWIMRNRADAEELHRIIGDMLNGTDGMVMI